MFAGRCEVINFEVSPRMKRAYTLPSKNPNRRLVTTNMDIYKDLLGGTRRNLEVGLMMSAEVVYMLVTCMRKKNVKSSAGRRIDLLLDLKSLINVNYSKFRNGITIILINIAKSRLISLTSIELMALTFHHDIQ